MRRNIERITYWKQQMELGYQFMQNILSYPVHENSEKLLLLPEIVKKLV